MSFELDFERNDKNKLTRDILRLEDVSNEDRKCKIKDQNPLGSRHNFFFNYFS